MSVITIRNGPLAVTPDPVYITKGELEEIEWQHEKGLEFDVDFGGAGKGPFASHHFKKGQKSGTVRTDVAKGSQHKYTVKVGSEVLDPIIIVR